MTVRVNDSRRVARVRALVSCGVAVFVLTAGWACGEHVLPSTPGTRLQSASVSRSVIALGDTSVTTFTLDPSQNGWYPIAGNHYLYVGAGGLCDLSSPYGPDYWDTPCDAATSTVDITAKSWVDDAGSPHIEFQPALRFAALKGKYKTAAFLFMYDPTAVKLPHSTILYCSDDGQCVDEGEHDRLLRTDTDEHTGYLFRQIKHFSGYEVSAGFARGF